MAGKGTPAANAPAKPGKKQPIPKKPKKPMPRFMLVVLSFLVFLLLLAGAGYCLYTNVAGMAEKAMVLLPQYRASMADLERQQKDLADAQEKLRQDQDRVAEDAAANLQTADGLKTREDKLAADQKAFEEEKRQALADEEKKQKVLDIYANLDPADAAAMLATAPTLAEAADILRGLPTDTAAKIVAAIRAIDAQKAYDLTILIGK